MPDDVIDALTENAQGPKSVQGDSSTITQHGLREQIEAAKFLNEEASTAGAKKKLPIRFAKIKPGGAI